MTFRDKFTPTSEQVYYDNADCDLVAEDVKSALDELCDRVATSASPGFGFGRSGNVSAGTWLLRTGSVPSNKTGVAMAITDPVVVLVSVGNEDISTFDIEIYEHEGSEINLTLLGTVSIISARTAFFSVNYSGTTGKQIAVKLSSGSAKNPGVDLQLSGSI